MELKRVTGELTIASRDGLDATGPYQIRHFTELGEITFGPEGNWEQAALAGGIINPVAWSLQPYPKTIAGVEPPYGRDMIVRWRNQIRENKRFFSTKPCESLGSDLGAHAGRTAIIVGSGPSLMKNIKEINALVYDRPNEYIVIGINSTIDLLDEIDYYVYSERDFDVTKWQKKKKAWWCHKLVAFPFSHPSIFEEIDCNEILLVNQCCKNGLAEEFREWWRKTFFHHELTHVPHMQETASLALYVANHIRCDRWILVGMDYCYTDAGYYAGQKPDASIQPEDRDELTRDYFDTKDKDIAGTDVYGNTVKQSQKQVKNLLRHEIALSFYQKYGGVEIINATQGGMLKHGVTRTCTLQEAIQ